MKRCTFLLTVFVVCLRFQAFAQDVGIDKTEAIDIGGIKQVISIKGKDAAKPLLLYLHGASGNASASVIAKADALTSKLQEHFVVVLWDQRDYGQTLALNKSPQSPTLAVIERDTLEMVEYLLKKFGREKLFIAGHSMGTILGFYIAQNYPELLNALVAISPPVNSAESQKLGLIMLKRHFKKLNNQKAIKELAQVKSPANDFDSMFIQYRWQSEFDGERVTDEQIEQVRPILKKALENMGTLFNEINHLDLIKSIPSLKCPVYFFAGRKDFQTNANVTKKFYEQIKAPRKGFFWFEKSAHDIPGTESDLMQEIIITKILPKNQ